MGIVNRQLRLAGVSLTAICAFAHGQAQAQDGAASNSSRAEAGPAAAAAAGDANAILVRGDRLGSAFARDLAARGTQVQVITSEEIKAGGFVNFAELANNLIQGANVGYSPDEGEFTIRLDGGSDSDTLLLLDGVPTFDRGTPLEAIWGATGLNPRMVETVEVFRGGQSLYYGGNGGLGVISVNYKQPDGREGGTLGIGAGSFMTGEIWGDYTFNLDTEGRHSVMVFGRGYQTDSTEIFDETAYTDTIVELGGVHEFPLGYQNIGVKYLWRPSEDTDVRLSAQFSKIDFRDAFPQTTVYAPNTSEFPIFNAEVSHRWSNDVWTVATAYYTEPKLFNTELVPALCQIPQDVLNPATSAPFKLASDYEAYAAANGLPLGCVLNPSGSGNDEFDVRVDENGNPYGTIDNPIRIGDPIGTQIDSAVLGRLVKGYGSTNQFKAGYRDYGFNIRTSVNWNEFLETVIGVQRISYQDASHPVYQVSDLTLSSTGVYIDLRPTLPFSPDTNLSFAYRRDFNDGFADRDVWKIGLRQNLPWGFYIRANGGTSYANPSLSDIGTRVGTVNNPELETELTETLNVGAGLNRDFAGGSFSMDVGYFDTTITNFIRSDIITDVAHIVPGSVLQQALDLGLDPDLTSVSYNQEAKQPITGFNANVQLALGDAWSFNLSFTSQEVEQEDLRYDPENPLPGISPTRQLAERPEWVASGAVTYRPDDRWSFALLPRLQGPEWAYPNNRASSLLNDQGERAVPDINFGNYFVLNATVQHYLGTQRQHRLMLRVVNIFDEEYAERYGIGSQNYSRAAARGTLGVNDRAYYRPYAFKGKPRSVFVEYSREF